MRQTRTNIRRRDFVKGLAGAACAPYVITTAALGSAEKAPASERVTLAHLGCGERGNPVSQYFQLRDAQYVAVCDPFQSRRERFAQRLGGKPYRDLREMLARDDIDLVINTTADHWHILGTVMAAKAGKDVYCEKPFALCLGWALEARRVLKRLGRVFQWGTQGISNETVRHVADVVRSGRIGTLRRIEVGNGGGGAGGSALPRPVPADLDYDLWLGPAAWKPFCEQPMTQGNWINDYDYSVGWLGGWGSHYLAVVQLAFDAHLAGPWQIEAKGQVPANGRFNCVIGWDARFEFANGVTMHYTTHTNIKFIGTEGWVSCGWEGGANAEPKSLLSPFKPDDVQLRRARGGHGGDLVAAVKDRGPTTADIDLATNAEMMVHLPDIAVRTGRKITWDPKKEAVLGDEEASRLVYRALREPWQL
jgi:predicted dehydrogenase